MPLTRLNNNAIGETITAAKGGTGVTSADEIGNLVLLHNFSSTTDVDEVDFSSYFSTSYDDYILHWSSLPATDNVKLVCRFKSNGSMITDSSAYGYAGSRIDSGSRVVEGTNTGGLIDLTGAANQGNASGETSQGIIKLTNINSSSFSSSCFWEFTYEGTTSAHLNVHGSGHLLDNTTVCDGFVINYNSGNISEYEYRLYGVKQ
jgi:hypothetical protein